MGTLQAATEQAPHPATSTHLAAAPRLGLPGLCPSGRRSSKVCVSFMPAPHQQNLQGCNHAPHNADCADGTCLLDYTEVNVHRNHSRRNEMLDARTKMLHLQSAAACEPVWDLRVLAKVPDLAWQEL